MEKLVEATNGLSCDVDAAMVSLLNKERRSKKPFPWKASLEIGPDVRINVVGYIQVKKLLQTCSKYLRKAIAINGTFRFAESPLRRGRNALPPRDERRSPTRRRRRS